jgi:5'-nucleotidase / UDP-sugar diphosphatase
MMPYLAPPFGRSQREPLKSLGKFRLASLAVCAIALGQISCLPVQEGSAQDLRGQQVRLTFLHTSDIHSRLVPFDFAPLRTDQDLGLISEAAPFGGAARMAALVKRERAAGDRVLHLDSGDCFQGAPIFNLNDGEAEFRVLSEMQMDAAVVGNHEFDSGGLNFAEKARDFANFPLLAANYIWSNPADPESHKSALYTAPYSLHNMKGVKVAVIGMANISSLNSIVEGGNSLQIKPLEQNEAARAYVDFLRPMVDVIVIVSHLGLHEDQELIRGYEAYYRWKDIRRFVERDAELAALSPQHAWRVLGWSGPEDHPESVVRVWIPGVSGIDVVLGGHLHVVLNPPQTLTDPDGRKVVLAHSGAFAKYVGKLDVVVTMPMERHTLEGAEVSSHDYKVFPIDALWCDDAARSFHKEKFWNPGEFARHPLVIAATERCARLEDPRTLNILEPYLYSMDFTMGLTTLFAYAPRDVSRRNNSTGGDSPLGNMTADSMRLRRRVEAEVALTNSLGIRDNLYAGPVTQESMFNVFPFENTINIMYLSGREMQELFDFVTVRSAGRGCQSQAQISGARFTMDCAQAQLNDIRTACETAADCPAEDREGRNGWQCLKDTTASAGRCWAPPAVGIRINGELLNPSATYKIAVNDYIAKGGSGFEVLKRNTTRIETGISLRDSLMAYMQGFCSCQDILEGKVRSERGEPCGVLIDEHNVKVDDQVKAFCDATATYEASISRPVGACTCREILAGKSEVCQVEITDQFLGMCGEVRGPTVGTCSCADVLRGDKVACGHITLQLKTFCQAPLRMGIAAGIEDGRIQRRVK